MKKYVNHVRPSTKFCFVNGGPGDLKDWTAIN